MIVRPHRTVQPELASFRITGFAVVSQNNMIATTNGSHPDELWLDADQCFYRRSLEQADVIVHGRNSKEYIPGRHSPDYRKVVSQRRRIVATRAVPSIRGDTVNPNAVLWNPEGAPLTDACSMLGVRGGTVIVNGGTQLYELFLTIGYDLFFLSLVNSVAIASGRPLFSAVAHLALEDIFDRHGLELGSRTELDIDAGLSLLTWTRKCRLSEAKKFEPSMPAVCGVASSV